MRRESLVEKKAEQAKMNIESDDEGKIMAVTVIQAPGLKPS